MEILRSHTGQEIVQVRHRPVRRRSLQRLQRESTSRLLRELDRYAFFDSQVAAEFSRNRDRSTLARRHHSRFLEIDQVFGGNDDARTRRSAVRQSSHDATLLHVHLNHCITTVFLAASNPGRARIRVVTRLAFTRHLLAHPYGFCRFSTESVYSRHWVIGKKKKAPELGPGAFHKLPVSLEAQYISSYPPCPPPAGGFSSLGRSAIRASEVSRSVLTLAAFWSA